MCRHCGTHSSRPKQSKVKRIQDMPLGGDYTERFKIAIERYLDVKRIPKDFFLRFPQFHAGVKVVTATDAHDTLLFAQSSWVVYNQPEMGNLNGVYCKMTFGPRHTIIPDYDSHPGYISIQDFNLHRHQLKIYFGMTGTTYHGRFGGRYPRGLYQYAGHDRNVFILINTCNTLPPGFITDPDRYFSRNAVICMVEIFLMNSGMHCLFCDSIFDSIFDSIRYFIMTILSPILDLSIYRNCVIW